MCCLLTLVYAIPCVYEKVHPNTWTHTGGFSCHLLTHPFGDTHVRAWKMLGCYLPNTANLSSHKFPSFFAHWIFKCYLWWGMFGLDIWMPQGIMPIFHTGVPRVESQLCVQFQPSVTAHPGDYKKHRPPEWHDDHCPKCWPHGFCTSKAILYSLRKMTPKSLGTLVHCK